MRRPGETRQDRFRQFMVGLGVAIIMVSLPTIALQEYQNNRSQINHHAATIKKDNQILSQNQEITVLLKEAVRLSQMAGHQTSWPRSLCRFKRKWQPSSLAYLQPTLRWPDSPYGLRAVYPLGTVLIHHNSDQDSATALQGSLLRLRCSVVDPPGRGDGQRRCPVS